MSKKKKYNLLQKIRSKLREIYMYSPMRREALNKVTVDKDGIKSFKCKRCSKTYPIQFADVHHVEGLGQLESLDDLSKWAKRLFYGDVTVICKACHKIISKRR